MVKSLDERAFDFRVRAGYTAAFILLLLSYIVTLFGNSQLKKQTGRIKQVNNIIQNLDGLLSGMKDAETGIRGYINTKDNSFLLPYKNSFAPVNNAIAFLKKDTKGNAVLERELIMLTPLIAQRYDELSFAMNYFPKNNYVIGDSLLRSFYKGRDLMDSIRNIANTMQKQAQGVLDSKTQDFEANYKALNIIVITSLVIALVFAGFGFYTYRREHKTRVISDKRSDASDKRSDISDKRSDASDKRSDISDKRSDESDKRSDESDKRSDESDKRSDESDKRSNESDKRSDISDRRSDESDKRSDISDKRGNDFLKQLQQRVLELDTANKEIILMKRSEKFAATGRMARTIAHEVRNPLTNIDLAVAQIKSDMPAQDENSTMLFDMVIRNSHRINLLISELLSATRFVELNYTSVSINVLLDESLELAKDRIDLNRIKIEKYYAVDICDISVDPDKIKIAFLNLIVNAIEAMEPNKGILQIYTGVENGKCIIEIKDNGYGMTEEQQNKLFEPYFTTKTNGNGLGLTNTQNIILNHKGNISVNSKPGEGTSFFIKFDFVNPA